jgi:hypothetical protein
MCHLRLDAPLIQRIKEPLPVRWLSRQGPVGIWISDQSDSGESFELVDVAQVTDLVVAFFDLGVVTLQDIIHRAA